MVNTFIANSIKNKQQKQILVNMRIGWVCICAYKSRCQIYLEKLHKTRLFHGRIVQIVFFFSKWVSLRKTGKNQTQIIFE